MTYFQRENELKLEETQMEQSSFKEIERKHKTEMLSKEKLATYSANLKEEMSNKNKLFEAQTQALKASELAHEKAKEYQANSDFQLSPE